MARRHGLDPLQVYLRSLVEVFPQFGLKLDAQPKERMDKTVRETVLMDDSIGSLLDLSFAGAGRRKTIRIKLEIDTNPPSQSGEAGTFLDFPADFQVRHQDLPSNFALKIHALLCRGYLQARIGVHIIATSPPAIIGQRIVNMTTWTTRNIPDQSGKLAIVTGATGGLGLETALALAGAGAEVILAARNPTKGHAAEARIRASYRNANVRFDAVDLASLASVRAFAERALAAGRPIDILVNNAGVMALPKRKTTADGFEMQFGTNYLSHFALTAQLLPLLIAAKARVVQLSSIAHRSGRIRLDDLNYAEGYKPWPVYSQSKLAMLMFAIELDRRSEAKGWGLTSVAAHPGAANTDLIANGPGAGSGGFVPWVSTLVLKVIGHSAAEGALPQLMAATMPGISESRYFGPQGWKELKGPPGPGRIEPQALDAGVAGKLWAASEKLTGVTFG